MHAKNSSNRFSLSIKSLAGRISIRGEISLPNWLVKSIALVIAHLIATQVFGLEGADALLQALTEVMKT